jgi:hypothetical protein
MINTVSVCKCMPYAQCSGPVNIYYGPGSEIVDLYSLWIRIREASSLQIWILTGNFCGQWKFFLSIVISTGAVISINMIKY